MSSRSRCPVCAVHLRVRTGVLPRHRDRRFDVELLSADCPGSGQALITAAASVAARPKEPQWSS